MRFLVVFDAGQAVRRCMTAAALVVALIVTAMTSVARATPPATFNPVVEAQNFSITQERQAIYDTPGYQSQLTVDSAGSTAQALATEAADPGRFFTDDLCWNLANGCAGDIRLNNWANDGDGIVRPVLFTARDGATISGHVWATVAGPAKRPAIVITNGSVQADEQMYWYAAQTLAKDGYVVLTFDPQGQGQSDMFGEGSDRSEGVPAQSDGRPFYDGTEDAIDFLLSTPGHPYQPVKSCSSGTSHAAKQNDRVKAGLDAAYDPYYQLLNPKEIGLVGHSYGASGVSYISQWDPRIKAVVALDNLAGPSPNATEVGDVSGFKESLNLGEHGCPGDPADRTTVPVTQPGLGISADYFLPPTPNVQLPDPTTKELESQAYSKAGVDSGEIVIRGGSHLDFSFIPNQAFGASLRGPDLTDWYTSAWFDRYLKHEQSADARLLSQRWREDPVEAGVDPNHDGNAFSFYYNSRLDIRLAGGQRFDCEDLRDGCAGMVSHDGYNGNYSYVAIDTSRDAVTGPGSRIAPSALTPCTSRSATKIRLTRFKGRAITRARVYVDGHTVSTERARRGKSLRSVVVPGLAGTRRHTIRVYEYTRRGFARKITRKVYGCAHKAGRRKGSRK